MTRDFWSTIAEVEAEIGGTIDSNFDPGVNGLCHGDTCHDECECWDSLKLAAKEHLEANKACCQKCFQCNATIDNSLLCVPCGEAMQARIAMAETNIEGSEGLINYDADKGVILEEPMKAHDLFKNGDENIPNSICDTNGDVVLALCKVCHKGESELDDSPFCQIESEKVLPEDLFFAPERTGRVF